MTDVTGALFDDLPVGWHRKCKVKPGIHHDDFLTGEEREVERPSGGTFTIQVHECRKCGEKCRWVKLDG